MIACTIVSKIDNTRSKTADLPVSVKPTLFTVDRAICREDGGTGCYSRTYHLCFASTDANPKLIGVCSRHITDVWIIHLHADIYIYMYIYWMKMDLATTLFSWRSRINVSCLFSLQLNSFVFIDNLALTGIGVGLYALDYIKGEGEIPNICITIIELKNFTLFSRLSICTQYFFFLNQIW